MKTGEWNAETGEIASEAHGIRFRMVFSIINFSPKNQLTPLRVVSWILWKACAFCFPVSAFRFPVSHSCA